MKNRDERRNSKRVDSREIAKDEKLNSRENFTKNERRNSKQVESREKNKSKPIDKKSATGTRKTEKDRSMSRDSQS